MTVDDLKRRYDYGYWANERLFAVIAQLTTAEFTRGVAGSLGSIRTTLVHVMSAEWGWIDRCGGPTHDDDLRRVIEFSLPQTGNRTMLLGEVLEHGVC